MQQPSVITYGVAGDLMLFELIVVRVHCIVCIVCDWRCHDYLVVRI